MVIITNNKDKEFHTFDIIKHLLCNIGQDIDGNFHADHPDFYLCFGTWHTQQGAIFIAILVAFIFVADLITCIVVGIWYTIVCMLIILPMEALLVYGVKKDRERFILPHLIISVFMIIVAFGILILVTIAAIVPNIFYSKWISIIGDANFNTQLVCLMYALAISITMVLLFWINWCLYIHYRYLQGINRSIRKSQDVETGSTVTSEKSENANSVIDV